MSWLTHDDWRALWEERTLWIYNSSLTISLSSGVIWNRSVDLTELKNEAGGRRKRKIEKDSIAKNKKQKKKLSPTRVRIPFGSHLKIKIQSGGCLSSLMDQNREAQVHRFRGGCTSSSSGTAGGWFPTPLRWVGLSGLSWWRAGGEPRCWRPSARMAGGRPRRRAGRGTWEGEGGHKRRRYWSGSRLKAGFLVRINPRFTYAKLNRSTNCTVMWPETSLFGYLVIDGQQILLQS